MTPPDRRVPVAVSAKTFAVPSSGIAPSTTAVLTDPVNSVTVSTPRTAARSRSPVTTMRWRSTRSASTPA